MPDAAPIHGAQIRTPLGHPAHLPELIRRYVERAIPPGQPVPTRLRVEQIGDMWRAPGGKPMHFTATEDFAVHEVAFSWRAGFPIAPLLTLRIHDGFADGAGWMRGRLCGVPFMNRGGPDLAVGAAMRYLAELPWAPHALLANRRIKWRQIDDHTVEASTETASGTAAVALGFDEAGDIVRTYADSRPRDGDVPRPWGGILGDYKAFDGVRLPTAGEVRWELPEGPFTYWRGTVTALELIYREE